MDKTIGRASLLRRLVHRLDAYWFQPMRPQRLACVRGLLGAFVAYTLYSGHANYVAVARGDAASFAPLGPVTCLSGPLTPETYGGLLWVTFGLSIAFTLGLAQRLVAPLLAVTVVFTLAYRNSWGMNYHHLHLMTLQVLAFVGARSADVWSLDSMLSKRTPVLQRWLLGAQVNDPPAAHARYGWPIRLICGATVCAYFVAGVAKLSGSAGWSWLGGENLRDQIAYNALVYELIGAGADPSAWTLYRLPAWIYGPLASGSFMLEIAAPLALAHPRAGRLWALATWGMHVGIRLTMAIRFPFQVYGFAFAPFLELDRALTWLGGEWRRRTTRPTLS